jgi:predicted AlkP superfamily phosphohydrolase/phosphomutase
MMADGKLSVIDAIYRDAFKFDVDSGVVPYEPPNLTSAFSGRTPGEHGCYSYWSALSDGDMPRILTSKDVAVPRIWDWPSLSSKKFSVVNVQLTHPAEPLYGTMLSYLMQQSLRYSYPQSLAKDLNQQGVRFAHDVSAFFSGQPQEEFVKELERVASFQLEAALHTARDVDILVFNITLPDRVSHFYWNTIEANDSQYENPIANSYRFVCEALVALKKASNGCPILVFTEMGFGKIDHFVSLDRHLIEHGMLCLDEKGMHSTRCIARESVQGTHGVNILNASYKRDPSGYESRVSEVTDLLLSLKDEEDNRILVSARRRDDVYHGEHIDNAPDLIVVWGAHRKDLSRTDSTVNILTLGLRTGAWLICRVIHQLVFIETSRILKSWIAQGGRVRATTTLRL